MRMMRHHHICAELQILQVAIARIGAGQAGEFLAAMGDHHAPSAPRFDLSDARSDPRHIVPAEDAGRIFRRGDTLRHVGNAEHADAARLKKIHRLGRLLDIQPRAEGFASHLRRNPARADHAVPARIHGVVVADAPDIRAHFLQHARRRRVHAVKEHAARSVVRRLDQRALNVGDGMIRAMKKIEHGRRQQVFILPAPVHVPVKPDIARKHNRRFLFGHVPLSLFRSLPGLPCARTHPVRWFHYSTSAAARSRTTGKHVRDAKLSSIRP